MVKYVRVINLYKIYCHLFPNGKRYIGITKTSLERRFDNGNSYKTCPLIDRAIKKYGWENIEHFVLDTADTKSEAEEKERFYIAKYRTTETEFGYNVLPGGNVANNIPTEEMRYKLGNGWRGKHHTPEQCEKIRNAMMGQRAGQAHPLYGKKMSEETKNKMSESHIKRWDNIEARKERAEMLKRLWEDEEYRAKQSSSRKGKPSPKKGTHLSEKTKLRISAANKGKWVGEKSPCSKKVGQYSLEGELICVYASQMEAERQTGFNHANIAKCCQGKYKTVGGFVWKCL